MNLMKRTLKKMCFYCANYVSSSFLDNNKNWNKVFNIHWSQTAHENTVV